MVSFLESILKTLFSFENVHMSEGAVLGRCHFVEGKWQGAERGTAVLRQSLHFRAV